MSDNLYDVPSAAIVVVLVPISGIAIPISESVAEIAVIVEPSGGLVLVYLTLKHQKVQV